MACAPAKSASRISRPPASSTRYSTFAAERHGMASAEWVTSCKHGRLQLPGSSLHLSYPLTLHVAVRDDQVGGPVFRPRCYGSQHLQHRQHDTVMRRSASIYKTWLSRKGVGNIRRHEHQQQQQPSHRFTAASRAASSCCSTRWQSCATVPSIRREMIARRHHPGCDKSHPGSMRCPPFKSSPLVLLRLSSQPHQAHRPVISRHKRSQQTRSSVRGYRSAAGRKMEEGSSKGR